MGGVGGMKERVRNYVIAVLIHKRHFQKQNKKQGNKKGSTLLPDYRSGIIFFLPATQPQDTTASIPTKPEWTLVLSNCEAE